MWQILSHVRRMASRVVRARLDRPSEEGLALLMREGRTESEAVRLALVEHAERRAVMAGMEALPSDWPERPGATSTGCAFPRARATSSTAPDSPSSSRRTSSSGSRWR